ncbi:uncharacterized protein IL334_001364 [Kwoniella shivajii]|uniref:FAD/NAD(P)-binding domain-containing protein n=1 Tax=Kwoniella shivajii TaxID=564305 RepID=A0ABZ1CRP3_9TREE|nr:hypothetical protein IL334_001364 [Kwoniella shivajii]
MSNNTNELEQEASKPISVLIVGCGPAGLINARTLLQDGFKVTIVAKMELVDVGDIPTQILTTNSPWGSFTFSGLDMPKPSNLDGSVVPARTYRRYLEDFYHYFIKDEAEVLFNVNVLSLSPQDDNERGWTVQLRAGAQEETKYFDRVILATGYLGQPYVPDIFKSSPIPTFHTSALSYPSEIDKILASVPSSSDKPDQHGGKDHILVVGGGKSGMDTAALLSNRGKKVIWSSRGPLKWFSPVSPPGMMGANRMDIMFGPSRVIDSWTMWFYHCTSLGAGWVRGFWTLMTGAWSRLYTGVLSPPTSDPYLSLCHFAGGIATTPTNFLPLLRDGQLSSLRDASPTSIDEDGVAFKVANGHETAKVQCGATVLATGYRGGTYDFINETLRHQLGLERVPPPPGSRARVLALRKSWKTVQSEDVGSIQLPLVLRGILPLGRFKQKDLAITGATKPLFIPAITYEVESHWISSLFRDDPFLNLPQDANACLKEINADNDFTRARYPGLDPYASTPSGTYFSGFNDLSYTRVLLSDMSLNPWRQKDPAKKWWKIWSMGWLDVRVNPAQYATLGEERKLLRRKTR